MHGIGLSAARYDTFYPFSPLNVGGGTLDLWLKYNTGIKDQSGNESPDLVDNIRITTWEDSSGNSNNAYQETQADMPRWVEESNSVNFANSVKFMDLTSDITVTTRTAFTVVAHINFQAMNNDSLCGSGTNDFIRFIDTNSIRILIGDSTQNDFNDSNFTFEIDKWYIIMVTRASGSSGMMNIYVKNDHILNGGSASSEVDFGLPHSNADIDEFVINNIGCEGDDTNDLRARMRRFLIWNGYQLTSSEREDVYDYFMGI